MHLLKSIQPLLSLLIIGLIVISCSAGGFLTYEEPRELDTYLQEFKSAADKRGYDLTIPKRFKVKLVDKVDGRNTVKGFCTEDIPMVIRLEKDYWMQADSTQKKILLFHEFGHCLLNRNHTNEILPNGEWKSLMRGGSLPEDRSYVINFRGVRMEYYWDELFYPNTPVPEWATRRQTLNIEAKKFENVIALGDTSISPDKWSRNDTTYASFELDNANYTIQNYSDEKLAVTSVQLSDSLNNSFIIDSELHFSFSKAEEGVGLMFGKPDSLEYIAVTPKLGIKIGNLHEFRPYATIPAEIQEGGETNRLTIQKDQNELLYFLNGELVYHRAVRKSTPDSFYIGYYVAPNSTLNIKNIDILF